MTLAIIAANALVFFLVQPQESPELDEFAYRNAAIACELSTGEPLDSFELSSGDCLEDNQGPSLFPDKNIWLAAFSSMFLHAGLAHIGFNMWSLWIFGNNVEEAFGHIGYIIFYLAAGLAATAGFVFSQPEATVPLVGASGAIAGVMGAYLVLFPRHQILSVFFFRVVAVPAMFFLLIWFGTQFFYLGSESGIAWEAHVAGFAFGALVALALRQQLLRRIGAHQRA